MNELREKVSSSVIEHLDSQTEESLVRAYEHGRHALTRGLGLLDIFALYEAVQRDTVLSAPPEDQPRIAAAVANFFRELLSPFEMSFRGYREANGELQQLNTELRMAYSELQAKHAQLVQSAKMASLGELVAGIAHEVNNPLAFVVSHLSTVRKSLTKIEEAQSPALDPEVVKQWTRAHARLRESEMGLQRIRELVLRLRTFSRLDEAERKSVSMRESVGSILTILSHRIRDRVVVHTHFGEPDMVDCFPGRLNQAIMNLVSNAIDACGAQGTIDISTGAQGDDYVITIADTGHGIPAELRDRVFEPFFTTKPVGQGTGLGLSISYTIVREHGGQLELRPGEAGGTIGTIRFPIHFVEGSLR